MGGERLATDSCWPESTRVPRIVREGPQVLLGHAGDLRQLGAAGALRWVGYLSSTSVYGDWGGACVDERCGPGGRWCGASLRRPLPEGSSVRGGVRASGVSPVVRAGGAPATA